MNTLDQNASVLDQAIRSCLNLVSDGYEYSGVKEAATAALGRYLEARFVHPRTHRKVTIAFLPESADPHAKEALCVHVTKNADDPYAGTFMVEDFLKFNGADSAALRRLDLSAYSGSEIERVKGVLSEVSTIFQTDLKGILEGTEWVDVPLDWGEYK